jgi:hypothetical protein
MLNLFLKIKINFFIKKEKKIKYFKLEKLNILLI